MLKKVLSATLFFAVLQLGMSQDAQAQKRSVSKQSSSSGAYYNNALGMRVEFGSGGALFGFSGKHFFTEHHAGEAQLLFGTGLTVLDLEYQYHAPIGGAQGLQWYAGMGLGPAFSSGGGYYESGSSTAFFMRPLAGLDYKVANAPLNLAFDWRPTIWLSGGSEFIAGRFGLAARYAF